MSAILAVHYHLQLVLKDCAHAGVRGCSFCRQLHSLQPQARKLPTSKDSKLTKSASPKTDEDKQLSSHSESTKDDAETDFKNSTSTELVPRSSSTGSLQRPTGASVPVRVFPKAKDRDGVLLSPIDRLRLESITRRPPPRIVKKPAFPERLLIYHGGLGYTNYIALLRVATMLAASFGILIAAPAYYTHETAPWWTSPLILAGTTGPFLLVHFLTRHFVCWIHLVLPLHARKSRQAALEYSKTLPRDALLRISFMRATALVGQVEARVSELVPKRRTWPPTTFTWVGRRMDTGPWWNRKITQFFVNQRSGTGKAAKETVPGVWENVYKSIMGTTRAAHGPLSK